jgi:hypothetical protein
MNVYNSTHGEFGDKFKVLTYQSIND